MPCLTSLGLFFAITTLPCYQEQRGLVLLLVNYVLANIIWNLMIHHMTKKPFSLYQPTLILLVAPLVAHHLLGVSSDTERIIPQICIALATFFFFWKMVIVTKQW